MQTATVLPIGTPVIYYNQWTGFKTKAFRDQFVALSADDIKQLKEGDEIYVDIDPLHPNGKVYGRIKTKVHKLEPIGSGEFRIYYSGGPWSGFKTTRDGVCRDIEKAKDEQALAAIVSRLPLSKEIEIRLPS